MSLSRKRIFLAAGGTGGHFFPALSLARALQKEGHEVVIMTDKRAQKYGAQLNGLDIKLTHSATIFTRSALKRMLALLLIGFGVLQSVAFYLRKRPNAVIGFGGYPSFVPLMAAKLMLIPIAIHEQNAVLGRANRLLVIMGAKIAASYVGTRAIPANRRKHLTLTGNPVREEVLKQAQTSYVPHSPTGDFNLLVFGGSQGASVFSEILPAAIAKLPLEKRRRLKLVQQCRKSELRDTLKKYHELEVNAELRDFFFDMPSRMGVAHLIIGRSGASTVSELGVIGRPSILVPLPSSLDQDQLLNALQLTNHKAAELIEQYLVTPNKFAFLLEKMIDTPKMLETMASFAKKRAMPEATRNLTEFAKKLAGCDGDDSDIPPKKRGV